MKKIELGKEYVTSFHGLPVQILAVGLNTGGFTQVIGIADELDGTQTPLQLNEFGYRVFDTKVPFIREVNPYEHISKGDRVIVWDHPDYSKAKGYFAGVAENGLPLIWAWGKTEWSSDGRTVSPVLRKSRRRLKMWPYY